MGSYSIEAFPSSIAFGFFSTQPKNSAEGDAPLLWEADPTLTRAHH
jgi:hypothetical protein